MTDVGDELGLQPVHLDFMGDVAENGNRAQEFLAPEDRRVYLQIDGEFAGQLPAEIHIVPDALTLLVPEGYAR